MTEPDATKTRIGQGMEVNQHGDREAARAVFAQVWSDIGGESGDPLHSCALAHSMADAQDDVHDELVWDLRALEAAEMMIDEREPGHRKLGDLDVARAHLERGQAAAGSLGDHGYGRMIKGGLDRLGEVGIRLRARPQDPRTDFLLRLTLCATLDAWLTRLLSVPMRTPRAPWQC